MAGGSNPPSPTIGSAGTSDYQPSLGPLVVISIRRLRTNSGCELCTLRREFTLGIITTRPVGRQATSRANTEARIGALKRLENADYRKSGSAGSTPAVSAKQRNIVGHCLIKAPLHGVSSRVAQATGCEPVYGSSILLLHPIPL